MGKDVLMPIPRPKPFLVGYRNQVFIETGSHHGDGIQAALDAGFKCVYSTELNLFDYGWCACRFEKQMTKVHLFNRDSRQFLRDLLPGVTTRCTFWLDAHECGSGGGDSKDCPLTEELLLISLHEIKDHTILIDDVRLFGSELPALDEVKMALTRINPDFEITFVNSSEYINDILVARLPSL
jgi:hypothetical protein